jgi:hypothetical protein
VPWNRIRKTYGRIVSSGSPGVVSETSAFHRDLLPAVQSKDGRGIARRSQPRIYLTAGIGMQVRRSADVSLTTFDRSALKLGRTDFNVTSMAELPVQ